jgi:alkyl sulfatase BDS1-like metallo-beta-lactamase superfamily hydrolase
VPAQRAEKHRAPASQETARARAFSASTGGEADVLHVQAQRRSDLRAHHIAVHQIVERLVVDDHKGRVARDLLADQLVQLNPRGVVGLRGRLVDLRVDTLVRVERAVDRAPDLV